MRHNQASYRTIVKGTAIFGGAQVFNILINLVRGKLVAMFLGPTGLGVSSLFTSTTGIINQITGFGLHLSGVKDISEANEQGNVQKLNKIITIFRKSVLLTGILAVAVAIIGAPYLSQTTFGSQDYTWEFVALSIMLFFTALSSAETTILQSTHRLQYLAKASMIGAITGLVAGVPLYYCFGTKGIVPAMIILALVSFLTNSYFTQKMTIKHSSIPMREAVREGKHMFFLGSVMMISSLIGLLSTYILNIYIRTYGSLDDVGLYQAANSITNQYVGLVFTAMGIDYFPRLATVCKDNGKVREMVCDQLDVVMLIVTPLLILIILIAPLLVKLLLTDNFLPVIPLLRWFGLAIFFKALTYPVGYISFSKGDKKTFFWLEGIYTNFMILALSITGYRLWGINGLGIAMTIALVLYFIVLSIVVKIRYNFVMRYALLKTIIPLFLAVLGSFLICQLNPGNWKSYGLTTVILIAISFYSYKELDLRLDLRSIVQKLRNK